LNDELYDPEIPRKKGNKAWKIDAPTPEEIRERCLEIQSTWDEETRLSRIVDHRIHPDYVHTWTVPMIRIGDLDGDAESVVVGIVDIGSSHLAHENSWHTFDQGGKRKPRRGNPDVTGSI
jgi:hypothetical protein